MRVTYTDINHQYIYTVEIVKPIAALLSDADQGPFRTIIVDSIIALFRAEFSGRGELADRQQKVNNAYIRYKLEGIVYV